MEKRIPEVGELFYHGEISSCQPVYIRLNKKSQHDDYFRSLQIIGYQLDPTNHEWDTKFDSDDITSFSCELVQILYGAEK